MKQNPTSRALYDNSELSETEFALDISPCPNCERSQASKDIGASAKLPRKLGGLDRRRQAQSSRQSVFEDDDLTDTLTAGWAIALAIAVAVVISVSGG